MSATHCASAHIERRTGDAFHTQRLCSYSGAGDVHNGVNRAHLMEVNFFNIGIVDLGLRRSQHFKDPGRSPFGSPCDCSSANNLPDFLQPAMTVRMRVVMLMAMLMPMRVAVLMIMAVL